MTWAAQCSPEASIQPTLSIWLLVQSLIERFPTEELRLDCVSTKGTILLLNLLHKPTVLLSRHFSINVQSS